MKLEQGFTLVVPYYRNAGMLQVQLAAFARYDDRIRIIVIDDGSPERADQVLRDSGFSWWTFQGRLQIYRVLEDIPWNRGGARNLGAQLCETNWLMHMDIDHVLPIDCANGMLSLQGLNPFAWYRFPRFRVGQADETRKKDLLHPSCEFGPIKPHIDSYLCTKSLYWLVGGYDEDYSGCLGGGSPFLQQLEAAAPVRLLPGNVHLHVHTRTSVKDASDFSLSRDTSEYSRRRKAKEAAKNTKAKNPIRFDWERVL